MPNPFPGMDPYLENPKVFPGIHGPMVTYLRDQLSVKIEPRYVASVGERVYLEVPPYREFIPDASIQRQQDANSGGGLATEIEIDQSIEIMLPELEIRQPFIEILDTLSGMQVVTVIELLSPSNKYAGRGQISYVQKQREVRESKASLVEIDLLRRGPHVLAASELALRGKYDYDYAVCVNRAKETRTRFKLYLWTLRQPIPKIAIPLAGDDPDVAFDVREALVRAYAAGGYARRIDYRQPCQPALSDHDQRWVDDLLGT